MNIQDYILSGIIESYVLGLASEEERKEFEQLCIQYPEIKKAREAFEFSLEKNAMDNAVSPSAIIKEKIFSEIKNDPRPAVIKKINSNSWTWYAAAACFIFLLGSLYWNYSLYQENKKLQGHYKESLAQLNEMENDVRILQQNPNVKMASMKGMDASPQSYATVYWDTTSHDVYLLANNLPAPPTDKQYQLWALLDNKPIDLGMLDYGLKQKKLLVRMKNAQNAQAFAITLERKDRPDPSVPKGDMYVMGKL
jgi:anti-sigma-K factor RskA